MQGLGTEVWYFCPGTLFMEIESSVGCLWGFCPDVSGEKHYQFLTKFLQTQVYRFYFPSV